MLVLSLLCDASMLCFFLRALDMTFHLCTSIFVCNISALLARHHVCYHLLFDNISQMRFTVTCDKLVSIYHYLAIGPLVQEADATRFREICALSALHTLLMNRSS